MFASPDNFFFLGGACPPVIATHGAFVLFPGVCPGFFIGHNGRPRVEVGFLGKGQQPTSHQLWGLGECCEPPAEFMAEPRRPNGFPLFSALTL